jgi:hypothetical protein
MLSTFGLQRLESGLHLGSTEVDRAAKVARDQARAAAAPHLDESGLPTGPIAPAIGNPQFRRTRYPNSV